jgi:hypothetical protein
MKKSAGAPGTPNRSQAIYTMMKPEMTKNKSTPALPASVQPISTLPQ